jgi:hypothetical protein
MARSACLSGLIVRREKCYELACPGWVALDNTAIRSQKNRIKFTDCELLFTTCTKDAVVPATENNDVGAHFFRNQKNNGHQGCRFDIHDTLTVTSWIR